MYKKLFLSKNITFIFFSLVGVILSMFFSKQMDAFNYMFGKEIIVLFLPSFFVVLFYTINGFLSGFSNKLFILSLFLFLVICIPFWGQLFKIVQPNKGDDFEKTFHYANNMIQNKTLWGGDQLLFKEAGKSYVMQPGFRYFVAFELLIFKELYRFISVLNLFLFLSALFFLQKTIDYAVKNRTLKILLLLLVILSVPYAAKNILMGLSEWLAVFFLIGSVCFYHYRNNLFLAVVFLAIVPFIRQNTLPVVMILFMIYLLKSRLKLSYLISFIAILLLPLYHNLYYAGEWRFFTSIFEWPFLNYGNNTTSLKATGVSVSHLLNNITHYIGFDFKSGHIDFMEESFLFLWLFVFLFIYMGIQLISKHLRSFYYLSALFLVLIPGVLLATDYYPRFEFVNIYLILAVFLILYKLDREEPFFQRFKLKRDRI